MPKANYNTVSKPHVKNKLEYLVCLACGKKKKPIDFYASSSVFNAKTGRVQYCKDCCITLSCDSAGNVDIDKFKDVLKKIDKPFLSDVLQSAYEESKNASTFTKGDPIRLYFKNINSLPQFNSMTWRDSVIEVIKDNAEENKNLDDEIIVNTKLVNFWGKSWEEDEYIRLEKFYRDMVDMNHPETPQDIDYIKKIAKLSVKIDNAIEVGDSGQAQKLGNLYSKYMADAKLRTSDTTSADKSGGIRRFCDIYAEVEKDGFVPPWEHYRKINGAKQDIVDKVIMYILNFMLKFNKTEKLSAPPVDAPQLDKDEVDEEAKMIDLSEFENDVNLDE